MASTRVNSSKKWLVIKVTRQPNKTYPKPHTFYLAQPTPYDGECYYLSTDLTQHCKDTELKWEEKSIDLFPPKLKLNIASTAEGRTTTIEIAWVRKFEYDRTKIFSAGQTNASQTETIQDPLTFEMPARAKRILIIAGAAFLLVIFLNLMFNQP